MDKLLKVIFLIQKSWQGLGILSKIRKKVLLIFQTMEDCDRQEDTTTGLASVKKNVKISRGKITSDSQIAMGSYFLIYLPQPI